jgi:rare lipoprotein A
LKIHKIFIVLALISVVGFTLNSNESKKAEVSSLNEELALLNSSEVNSQIELLEYVDRGKMLASWYGPRFHGRKTANGEVFDQLAFTAAHKKFRFGTLLRLTNPNNERSIIVRINDRGPYIRGRELDLSRAAANELGIIEKGVARLNIEQVTLRGMNFPVITLN